MKYMSTFFYALGVFYVGVYLTTGDEWAPTLTTCFFAAAFAFYRLSLIYPRPAAITPTKPAPDYGVIAKHEHEFDILPHVSEEVQNACGGCRARKKAERREAFHQQQKKFIAENREEWLKNKRAQYGVEVDEPEVVTIYADNEPIRQISIPGVTGFINNGVMTTREARELSYEELKQREDDLWTEAARTLKEYEREERE